MYLRKGNLQFLVEQDNNEKSLKIKGFKKLTDERRGGDYFGFVEEDILEKDFEKILPLEVVEIIEDNIEFSVDGHDLKEILDRFIHFKVLNKENKVIEMNVHTEREISDLEKFAFQITLEPKIYLREKVKSILETISNVQNVMHKQTGLINAQSFGDVLDEVMDFLYEAKIEGVMVIVTLEGFPNFRRDNGKKKADEMLGEIGYVMKSSFRSRDIVSYLGLGKFAIVLVKTFKDEAIYPIKRLESAMKKAGLVSSKISFNVRYESLDLGSEAKDEIEKIKSGEINYTISI